jgi:hypothetical protein
MGPTGLTRHLASKSPREQPLGRNLPGMRNFQRRRDYRTRRTLHKALPQIRQNPNRVPCKGGGADVLGRRSGTYGESIYVFAAGTYRLLRTITGTNTGLMAPEGIAVSTAGNIFVTNFANGDKPENSVFCAGASGTQYRRGLSPAENTGTWPRHRSRGPRHDLCRESRLLRSEVPHRYSLQHRRPRQCHADTADWRSRYWCKHAGGHYRSPVHEYCTDSSSIRSLTQV